MFRISLCLVSLLVFGSSAFAQFRAGVGKVDITPVIGVDEMADMNGKVGLVETVHDPLFARAIVFEQEDRKVAIISLDLLTLGNGYMDQIRVEARERLGLDDVFCVLTHTHASGGPTPAYSEKVVTQSLDLIAKVNGELVPARIGVGKGYVEESYNRRMVSANGVEMLWNNSARKKTSPLDNDVGVILIQNVEDASTLATLVNYNAHPVITMNFKELIISGDYPAVLSRSVAESLGGECFFLLGAAGDINAYDAGMFASSSSDDVFAAIERMGGVLAEEVKRVARGIEMFETDLALSVESFRLPMARRNDGLHGEKQLPIEVSTFLVGEDLAFVALPGEPFVELGLDLKERSPVKWTFPIAFGNGHHWYLPTIKATSEGGYGASSGTFLEVGAGERLVHQAIVNLYYQLGIVKELEGR